MVKKVESRDDDVRSINDLGNNGKLHLDDLVSLMEDFFWQVNEEFKFVYVTPQIEQILGYKPEDVMGESFFDYIAPSYKKETIEKFEEYKKNTENFMHRTHWLSEEKIEVIMESKIKTILDEDGFFKGFKGLDRNITDLLETEKSYKKIKTRSKSIFEKSSVGIAIIGLDGVFIKVNNALCDFLGYSEKELINIKFMTITHPDDINISVESLNSILKGFKKGDRLKKRYMRKDGGIVWADVNTILIRNDKGQPQYFITYIIDMTSEHLAQSTLDESERNIRAIFNTVHSAILLMDVKGAITFTNNFMSEMFGYEQDELLGMPYINLTFVDERYEAKENIKKMISGQLDHVFLERIFRRKNGKPFWGQLSGTRILNEDGTLLGLLGVITDITEHKKAIQDVDRFFNLSSDLLCIADNKGFFREVNPSWERVLGWDKETLISKQYIEFVHPEDRDMTIEESKKSMQGKKSTRFMNRYLAKDGSYKWLSWNSMPLPDENLVYASARDITDRKAIEDALKESEQLLSDIFDFLPDATFVINREGEVIAWNRAVEKMTGTSKEEILGKGDYAYAIPWYGKRRPILIDLINEEHMEYASKYDYVQKKGQTLYAEIFVPSVYEGRGAYLWVTASPLLDNQGLQYGAIESVRDITERKMADEQIKKSLKEKEVLLQEIHHRVKNNMQIISSLLNLQTQYVDEEAGDVLKESQNRVKSMSIIHEKLYRSKDFTRINIADYINSLVIGLFHSYAVKDGEIIAKFDVDDIKLNIETAVPCGLIISELVSNSLKYAFPEGKGEIFISLKEIHDKIELIISDNGIGLPEDLDIDNNDSLGLKLVKSLINQIDGELGLDRSHGTAYRIVFQELEYSQRI